MTGPAILICPADHLDRVLKAAALADAVIVDFEDAVSGSDRETARDALLAEAPRLHAPTTIVRINAMGTADCQRDVAAVRAAGLTTVMLPKAESAAQLEALTGLQVIALCETPAGVRAAPSIAVAANCIGLMWAPEDRVTAGARSSRGPDGRLLTAVLMDRQEVLHAARTAGIMAIDTIYPDVDDDAGLSAEAADAAAAGFNAKALIHARQVDIVQAAFLHAPSTNNGDLDA